MNRTPDPQRNTRLIDLKSLVLKQWGKDWNKPEVAYEFSNGRKFDDSADRGGPYTGTATT